MKGYLYQIFGEGIEELLWFPVQVSTDVIKEAYSKFESSDYDDFEEWWAEIYSPLQMTRVFVEEVYI